MILLAIKDNKIANTVLFYCTLTTHQIEIKKAEHTDIMKDIDVVLNIPGESKNLYKYFGKLFFSIPKTFEQQNEIHIA